MALYAKINGLEPQLSQALVRYSSEQLLAVHAEFLARVQLIDGQVKAILDMTGIRDANDYTTSIIYQGIRNSNPRWTWGGSD